jgi:O-antigen/teichoic acid export membrane protein
MAIPLVFRLREQTDILLGGLFLDPGVLAHYAVARYVVSFVGFGISALNLIMAPVIAELYSLNQEQRLQQTLTFSSAVGFAISLVVCAVVIGFGPLILTNIFGKQFADAYAAMVILTVGQVVNSMTGSVGLLLTMTEHQSTALAILCIGTATGAGLTALLVPQFGMIGAAIASVVSTSLWNCSMWVFSCKRLGYDPSVFSLVYKVSR